MFHIVILFLSLSPMAALSAQPKPPPKPPLQLSAEIVSQSYCAVTADAAALEMKLKLRYRNISSQKVILYNGHDLFYQTKIRSAPGNAAGPYEVWVVNSRYFDEEIEPIDQTSPSKVFLTLSPGAVYQREIMIGVGVVNDKVDRGDSSIRAGDHTLQLIVSTWYKPRSLAEKLRQQWQSKGLLWSELLVSAAMTFTVRPPRLMARCKSSN
jgi:hypothetical protein